MYCQVEVLYVDRSALIGICKENTFVFEHFERLRLSEKIFIPLGAGQIYISSLRIRKEFIAGAVIRNKVQTCVIISRKVSLNFEKVLDSAPTRFIIKFFPLLHFTLALLSCIFNLSSSKHSLYRITLFTYSRHLVCVRQPPSISSLRLTRSPHLLLTS